MNFLRRDILRVAICLRVPLPLTNRSTPGAGNPAMGSFLATFRNFAFRIAGEIVLVPDFVLLMRHIEYFPAGKKLQKWGSFRLFRGIFGILAGENRCGWLFRSLRRAQDFQQAQDPRSLDKLVTFGSTASTSSGLPAGWRPCETGGVLKSIFSRPIVVGAAGGKVNEILWGLAGTNLAVCRGQQ